MATIKAYTDISQSKKLAEILPQESADMCYIQDLLAGGKYGKYKPYIGDLIPAYGQGKIRCWSLAALLNVFPCSKESPIVNLTRGGWNPSFTRRWFATWEDENKNIFYSGDGITPVDAVVELILKLHEQKLI